MTVSVACCAADTPSLPFQTAWHDEFTTSDSWRAEPGWLSHPDSEASLSLDNGVATFRTPTPGRGMKWRRDIDPVWVPDAPYLVVRYRARGMVTESEDYFIYIDDGGKQQTAAMRLNEVTADGRWRKVGVDVSPLAETDTIKSLALQVQAKATGANVEVDFIRFCRRLPPDCQELRRQQQTPVAPDWWADLAAAQWTAQPAWLPNPATDSAVARTEGVTRFTVGTPGRGMKWSWFFAAPVKLQGHRYVCFRYRSRDAISRADYAVCVFAEGKTAGPGYAALIDAHQLRHNGRWTTVWLPLNTLPPDYVAIRGMAVQVQAGDFAAQLDIERLGLVDRRSPVSSSDFLAFTPVKSVADFALLPPVSAGGVPVRDVVAALELAEFPFQQTVAVDGIPFHIPAQEERAPLIELSETGELSFEIGRRCAEVYLLTIAVLRGKEDPVYLRDGAISSIREVDRLRLRLTYDDGGSEECFPFNASRRRFEVWDGVAVLCAPADSRRRLQRITLEDRAGQAGYAVLSATCRTAGDRLFPSTEEGPPAVRPRAQAPPAPGPPSLRLEGDALVLRSASMSARLLLSPLPRFRQLRHRAGADSVIGAESAPFIWEPRVENRPVSAGAFRIAERRVDALTASVTYETKEPPLRLTVDIQLRDDGDLALKAVLKNLSAQTMELGIDGPRVGPLRLGERLVDNAYVFPGRGWQYHNRPTFARARYGGMFPLQFMTVINPVADEGIAFRTEDRQGLMRDYLLEKNASGVSLWTEYPRRQVPAGETLATAQTVVSCIGGDWHEAFDDYVSWLRSWYRPLQTRPRWWREVFNFRQRFLHAWDPLYDAKSGEYHFDRALTEGREAFGGIEYLHLFDWGRCGRHGRIYGRTGDYSPYDFLRGGRQALRAAIAEVQRQRVSVGLYIEGYLLQENGKLGQAHGRDWQLIGPHGERKYWPNSTEMFICPWQPQWREVQAGTYATKATELGVDGMYVDEFGFAGPNKDCWSPEHEHPMPGYSVVGERGMLAALRQRIDSVRPGVVIYGEETPCDVNSQFQDGSFTYHMRSCRSSRPWAPLHLFRFAVPDFKTFEILVCDRPTGSWAEGVKWTFFNGEGLWIEGPASEWFAPHTLETIRRCHAILREHRDAFTSDSPRPLVPTLTTNVYANLFPTERKWVYTLYNANHRQVSAPMLQVAARAGARYFDAWNGIKLEPERRADHDTISLTLGPCDVGCVVCQW